MQTIQYDTVHLASSQKLTGSQRSASCWDVKHYCAYQDVNKAASLKAKSLKAKTKARDQG